ncbi:MAG: YciK family oxidoreductase [Pseudomonadota bacterium]
MPASPPNAYPELASAAEDWSHPPAPDALAGRTIVVTGAGAGIGAVVAKTFALYGAHVVLLGRTRERLDAIFDWITAHTETRPVIVPAELEALTPDAVQALAGSIENEYGHLDGLLHNASLLGPKVNIAHYPAADWQRVFQVNVHAAMVLTQGLIPILNAAPNALVAFTASSVGRSGRAFWGAYASSKFAVEGLMQVLADEIGTTSNVRTLSINPGGTRTAMRASAYPGEDPDSVPTAETHMDAYVQLFAHPLAVPHGQALNLRDGSARDWLDAPASSAN